MPIPKYYEMYQMFLNCLKDQNEHTFSEVKDFIADKMSISEHERKELLPSGKQFIFDNRVGWTRTYLKKAGLIESPSRGRFIITSEGTKLLAVNPTVINDDLLMRYESFKNFKMPIKHEDEVIGSDENELTPLDIIEKAYRNINQNLAQELLNEIMQQDPRFFEGLVVKLLEKMGYGGSLKDAGKVIGKSGDEGIDGIIREDKLGFDSIYIQAKKWDVNNTIGRPEIQKFVGALAGHGATKGLFITTSRFTSEARAYANKQHSTKIVLVDGSELTNLMIEFNLGVSTEMSYEIKKIDFDFFSE